MAKKPIITMVEARAMLDYDPETGEFLWKLRTPDMFEDRGHTAKHICGRWNSRYAGTIAGVLMPLGYIKIVVKYRPYGAQRLAWLWMTGEWPECVDHINHNPSDNRFSNLRACTQSENLYNARLRSNNTSGFKGVSWCPKRKKWRVVANLNKKFMNIGFFESKDDAADAYAEFARKHFGEFALPAKRLTS